MSPARPVVRTRLLNCPACGSGLQRVPRLPEDRVPGAPPSLRRFRCTQKACAWAGLIERTSSSDGAPRHEADDGDSLPPFDTPAIGLQHGDAAAAPRPEPSSRADGVQRKPCSRRRGALHLLGLGMALSALALLRSPDTQGPVAQPGRGLQGVPLGRSHDGDELPEGHPWKLKTVALAARALPGEAPLSLRRHCRWGEPGRSPYRGTVEQALAAARVPPAVAQQLALKIKARQPVERLVIDNRSVRSAQGGARVYAAQGIAMAFGTTMCLGTRVHFKPGHQEAADLYEASDEHGRRTAVMVPDVCGNVSVLSAAEDTGGGLLQALRAGGLAAGDVGWLAYAAADSGPRALPQPGTAGLAAAGLVAVWLARCWRRRRQAP